MEHCGIDTLMPGSYRSFGVAAVPDFSSVLPHYQSVRPSGYVSADASCDLHNCIDLYRLLPESARDGDRLRGIGIAVHNGSDSRIIERKLLPPGLYDLNGRRINVSESFTRR